MLGQDINRKPLARLLIVEDEALVALQLQRTLMNAGYQVLETVASGEDAVTKALKLHPDLVLMDILLAGTMDGVQAAGQIRSHLDIPVVYLSAHAEDERVRQSVLSEPFGYLAKPILIQELRTTIEMTLYKHQIYQLLKASEARWRTLVDHTLDAIIVTDEQFTILSWNQAAEQLYGWKAAEVPGQSLIPLTQVKFDHETSEDAVQSLLDHGYWSGEVQQQRKNGEPITILSSVTQMKDSLGKTTGVIWVNRDITGRQQSEQALKQLSRQNEVCMDLARIAYWEYDILMGLFIFNNRFYTLLGTNPIEAGGCQMSIEDFAAKYDPEFSSRVAEAILQAEASDGQNFEFKIDGSLRRADGNILSATTWFRIERDGNGKAARLYGVTQITGERSSTGQSGS